jgi:hypothetical protein
MSLVNDFSLFFLKENLWQNMNSSYELVSVYMDVYVDAVSVLVF